MICTFIFQHVSVHNSGEMINFLSDKTGNTRAHSPLLHLNWKGSSVAMDLPDHLGQHIMRRSVSDMGQFDFIWHCQRMDNDFVNIRNY